MQMNQLWRTITLGARIDILVSITLAVALLIYLVWR
jgi:hypothetical protein